MIKMICCVGSATLGVLLLSACGSTTPVTADKAKLSTGDTNAISTGGYWWTYTDHNTGSTRPASTCTPHTDMQTGLNPEVDSDAAHGKVIHFQGSVPSAPDWTTQVAAGLWFDPYWQNLYPKSLIAAFPAAGAGFGFQDKNKPYDAVQDKFVGFVFDMKTTGATNDVSVSVPIVGTDLADTSESDKFPTDGCIYPNKADATKSDADNFLATNPTQTCFLDYQKNFAMADRAGDDVWKTYCVLWSELKSPSWIGAQAVPPPVDRAHLKQALKIKWDMYKPPYSATATSSAFDVKLDNVKMVTEEDAAKVSACDSAAITASAAIIAQ